MQHNHSQIITTPLDLTLLHLYTFLYVSIKTSKKAKKTLDLEKKELPSDRWNVII